MRDNLRTTLGRLFSFGLQLVLVMAYLIDVINDDKSGGKQKPFEMRQAGIIKNIKHTVNYQRKKQIPCIRGKKTLKPRLVSQTRKVCYANRIKNSHH